MNIHQAAESGDFDQLRRALDADPGSINAPSHDGWTPLHLAAHYGHASIAAYLIARGADPLARSANSLENLPIHAAAAGRHAGIIALLIAAGTPVNATQHGGFTALHAAANSGDLASVEVLLHAGADAELKAENGNSAAGFALAANQLHIIDRLKVL